MSKTSKRRKSVEKRQQKRAAREARNKQFEAWRDSNQNSKRQQMNAKARKTVSGTKHEVNFCGNVACAKCFPYMSQHVAAAKVKAVREDARKAKADAEVIAARVRATA